ncbi:MAG TPA: CHAD domain-containing protein [Polyangia bacterium]
MSYQIKSKEPVAKAVRRIVRGQLKKAIAGGRQSTQSVDERVHAVRSRLKKARAAVKLVHHQVGSAASRDERWMREMARALSKARDHAVEADTLHRLLEQNPDRVAAGADQSLRDIGSRLRRRLSPTTIETRVNDVVASLVKGRRRVCRWPVNHGRRALRQGLEAAYKRARRRMRDAVLREVDGGDRAERLHGLRKSVKRLAMEVAVLRQQAPDLARRLGPALTELGAMLGEVHDLSVLRQTLERELRTPRDERNRAILFELIDQRSAAIEAAASTKGREALALRPKIIRRMLAEI